MRRQAGQDIATQARWPPVDRAGSALVRLISVDARATGRDRGALATLIESHHPDVACVHHGPSLLRWRSICAALGRRAGLVVVTGGRTAGANLILSTLGVDVVTSTDVSFAAGPSLRSGGAALAALRLRGREFVLAATDGTHPAEFGQALAGLVPGDPPAIVCAPDGEVVTDPRITVASSERVGPVTVLELSLPE